MGSSEGTREFSKKFRAGAYRFLIPVSAAFTSFYVLLCFALDIPIEPAAIFMLSASGAAFALAKAGYKELGLNLFLSSTFLLLWVLNYPSATRVNGFVSGEAYIMCIMPIVWWMCFPFRRSRMAALGICLLALTSIAVAGQPEYTPFKVPDHIVFVGFLRAVFILMITMAIGQAVEVSINLFEGRWKQSFADQDALTQKLRLQTMEMEREAAAHQQTLTNLMYSENRYRRLFDSAFEGIVITDTETRKPIEFNESICKLLGYSRKELLNLSMEEISPPQQGDGRPTAESVIALDKQLAGEKDVFYSWKGVSRFGEVFDFDIHSFRISGENHLRVHVIRNVTEQRKAQVALKNANKELGSFAHAASHDLKEPLRTMSSFAELLSRRYRNQLDENGREYLDYITTAALRGTRLVSDLLRFAEIGTDKVKTDIVKLNTIAATVKSTISARLNEEGATLTIDDLPDVIATPTWSEQLLQNLISNALKFKRKGVPPKVHVFAKTVGSFHEIHVQDNGIGIAEENLKRVFGVFERLHSSEEFEGSGIGLALCRRIMKNLGGTIRVESTYGEGTTFILSFPMLSPEPSRVASLQVQNN